MSWEGMGVIRYDLEHVAYSTQLYQMGALISQNYSGSVKDTIQLALGAVWGFQAYAAGSELT